MLLPGLISVVSSSCVVGVAYFGGFNGRVEGVIRNLTHQLRNAGLLDPQHHEIGGPDDILAKDRIVTPGEVVFYTLEGALHSIIGNGEMGQDRQLGLWINPAQRDCGRKQTAEICGQSKARSSRVKANRPCGRHEGAK